MRLDKNSYEILLDAYSPYIMFFGEDGDIYSYVHHARETTRICFPENDQPAFTQKWNGLPQEAEAVARDCGLDVEQLGKKWSCFGTLKYLGRWD